MKIRSFKHLAALISICWVGIGGTAEQSKLPKVPQWVWEKAQTKGVVRVIVKLNVPWQPEGKLSHPASLTQRQAIASSQTAVLTALVGTKHKITGKYRSVAGIGLEVGQDALAILESSPLVTEVKEDGVTGLGLQSVPGQGGPWPMSSWTTARC